MQAKKPGRNPQAEKEQPSLDYKSVLNKRQRFYESIGVDRYQDLDPAEGIDVRESEPDP